MIDPENLRTASLYINNQLLSRGLLRDGQNIDFADPEDSDGGLQMTMGRIISVVNDLILRRDRDAEHRESLSSTLRTMRADLQRQTTEFARQTERLNDTQRQLDIAEATERSLRTQLKTAEQGIHKLKEEMARMKSLVAQTRSACANEVRKRDRQIDSLKKAVADAGRVRGGAKSRDVITINVTGEFNGEGDGMGMPVGATENEGYSLSMETNGFLTELAKGLSEENEGLLALVRRTVDGLREMSGLDQDTNSGHDQGYNSHEPNVLVTQPPQKSAEELATELEAIVEHLRSILTNPSFVPIEEVEVRDEAINRLRAGLETMEARWKDAVHMIDGWRKRMVSSGKSVDIEDLQMGLRLSPVRVRDVAETANVKPIRLPCVQEEEEEEEKEEAEGENVEQYQHQDEQPEPPRFGSRSPESLRLVPASYDDVEEPVEDDDEECDSDSSIFQDDDLDMDDLDVEEPNVQILQMSTADSVDSSPLPEPPQISPLKDSYSSGNRGAGSTHNNPQYRKGLGDFTTIIEENTRDLAAATAVLSAPTSQPASPSQEKCTKSVVTQVDGEDALPSYTASYDSPLFGKSGERPPPNRKLFSKQPAPAAAEQRVRNMGARSQADKNAPPQPIARTTRSSARKSAERTASAVSQATKHTVFDADSNAASISTTTTTTSAAVAAPVSTSTSSSASATTRTSRQRQAAAGTAQRNTNSQSSSSSSSSSSSDNKQRPSASTNTNTRSPTRQPASSAPTSASSSSSSRLPRRPHAHAQHQQSPLNMATIAAKLAASEREADAARVRAKLRAVRRNRRSGGMWKEVGQEQEQGQEQEKGQTQEEGERTVGTAEREETRESPEDVDPVKRDPAKSPTKRQSPMKKSPRRRRSRAADVVADDEVDELALGYDGDKDRGGYGNGNGNGNTVTEEEEATALKVTKCSKRAPRAGAGASSKAASRRRSTLSPWELQGLITGNVGGVESPAR